MTIPAVPLASCEIKATWSGSWAAASWLIPQSGEIPVASSGPGQASLMARYGRHKEPGGTFAVRAPQNLSGYWVRVLFDSTQVWLGKIAAETRRVFGAASQATGYQTWTAYDGAYLLSKIAVAESLWENATTPDEPTLAGWLPTMNARDETRGRYFRDLASATIGNRSQYHTGGDDTQEDFESYVFGDAETWTNYQMAEYLLRQFAEDYDSGTTSWNGPRWRITGDTTILNTLKAMEDVFDWSDSVSILDALRNLIPRNRGMDFVVRPSSDDAGFDVHVFSLASQDYIVGSTTHPANPDSHSVNVGNSIYNQPVVLKASDTQRVGRIRVIGQRVVVCMTLYGSVPWVWLRDSYTGEMTQTDLPIEHVGNLVAKWADDLETDYKTAAGAAASAVTNDIYRTAEQFDAVYRNFGAPDDFDFCDGGALPVLDEYGEWDDTATTPPDQQILVRRTLSWTPLKVGHDYTFDPAADNLAAGEKPGLLPPAFYVAIDTNDKYKTAEYLGIATAVPSSEWGLNLKCAPGHLLAKNHWTDANATIVNPLYDWEDCCATIAVETDQRLALVYDLPGREPTDGTLDIEVPDAAFWWLAPWTVVGLTDEGKLAACGEEGRVLRNDNARLAVALAGHLARFYATRTAASLTYKGLSYDGDKVGQLMAATIEGAFPSWINAPITSWSWQLGKSPSTTINAGYA